LPYINNQKFNYILERNNIYIFKYDNLYNKIALINSSNILILSSISLTENQNLPLNSFFKLGSYRYNDEEFLDSVYNSFLVKYKTNPIYSENKLEINKEFSDENLCSQNYLGMYPVENPTVNESDCAYDFQIHGLKNYQTPEYEYSTSNPKFSDSPSIRRVYDKIFLGFHANTKKIDFKVDQDTKFYFPATSSRIPLSSCGLIEDGAVAGEVPYASDRIYLYKTNTYFMSTFTIVVLVAVIIGVATFIAMKTGKVADANNNNIPDALEEKLEDVKEVVAEVKATVKKAVAKKTAKKNK
jgi:hypothetical protein